MPDSDRLHDRHNRGQTCEKCARWFAWPFVGAQPTRGDYAGTPLCPDCYIDEEPRDAR